MRALIVEDEVMITFAIQDALEELGFTEFAIATQEADAIAIAREFAPDLMTVDVRLGSGSGIAAARSICGERKVAVVFITGNAETVHSEVREPVVVEKPFTAQQIADAVHLARTRERSATPRQDR